MFIYFTSLKTDFILFVQKYSHAFLDINKRTKTEVGGAVQLLHHPSWGEVSGLVIMGSFKKMLSVCSSITSFRIILADVIVQYSFTQKFC